MSIDEGRNEGRHDDADADRAGDGGSGLTEEFARIEAEIERDLAERRRAQSGSGEPPSEAGTEKAEAEGPQADGAPGPGPDSQAQAEPPGQPEPDPEQPVEPEADPEEAVEPEADPEEAAHPEADPEEAVEAQPEAEAPEPQTEAEVEAEAEPEAPEGVDSEEEREEVEQPEEPDAAEQAEQPQAEDASEEEAEQPQKVGAAEDAQAPDPPRIRPQPGPAVPTAIAAADEEVVDRTPNLWARFLAGSAVIIAVMAAATAISGLLFLSDVVAELRPLGKDVQDQLADVTGDAQTILLVGSDRRQSEIPGQEGEGLADTVMLVRIDPDRDVLSMLSLPRDLRAQIPGVGTDKLNVAYAIGGTGLTLRTVKNLTDLEVNHVVEVEFQGFADAIDAIDCVYVDVDRRYFHSNEGLPPDRHFAEIHVNAGYQRLCGLKALQYVRYRHTDNDLVRHARQQDFLRQARQKIEPRDLIVPGRTRRELINIFTSHTRSNIEKLDEILKVIKSFIAVRNVPVHQVRFRGDIGDADSIYVRATPRQIDRAVRELLEGPGVAQERKASRPGRDRPRRERRQRGPREADVIPIEELTEPGAPLNPVIKRGRIATNRVDFPVFYPERVLPNSTLRVRDTREYEIRNEDDEFEEAYKMVFRVPDESIGDGAFYGIMGTTWRDPPILRNPSETREIGGREYKLFHDGERLKLVGFHHRGSSYWVRNTLQNQIGEREMLAIATSMIEAK